MNTDGKGKERMTGTGCRLIAGASCMVVLLISGCGPGDRPSDPVSRRDMVGVYHGKWEPYPGRVLGRETLTLRRDGTYEQVFVSSGGRACKNAGKWSLERNTGGPMLFLENAGQYLDPWHDKLAAKPSYVNTWIGVAKHGRRMWLLFDDDLGLYYEKGK
jgi:hypothetical protein